MKELPKVKKGEIISMGTWPAWGNRKWGEGYGNGTQ